MSNNRSIIMSKGSQRKYCDITLFSSEQLRKIRSRNLEFSAYEILYYNWRELHHSARHETDFRAEQAEILAGVDGLAGLGQELRSACNLGGATSSHSRFHSDQDPELRTSKEAVLFLYLDFETIWPHSSE
jgi:hypothetical protein